MLSTNFISKLFQRHRHQRRSTDLRVISAYSRVQLLESRTLLSGVQEPFTPGLWLVGGAPGTPPIQVHDYNWAVDNSASSGSGGGGTVDVGLLTVTVDLTDFQRLGDVARGTFFSTLTLSEYATRGSNLVVLQKLLFEDAVFVDFTIADASDSAPGQVTLKLSFMELETTSYLYNANGVQTHSSKLEYDITNALVSQQTPLPGITTPNTPGLWLTGGTAGTPAAKVYNYHWDVDNTENINGGGGGAATVGKLMLRVDLTDFQRLGDVIRGRSFATLNLSEYETRGSNLVVLQRLLFQDAVFTDFSIGDAMDDGRPGVVTLMLSFQELETTSYLYDANGVQTHSSKLDYNIAQSQVSQQTPLPGITTPNAPGLWLTGGTTGTPATRVHEYHWEVKNAVPTGGGSGTATVGMLTLTVDLADFQRLGDVARGRFFSSLNLSEYDTRGGNLVVLQKLLFENALFAKFTIEDTSSDGVPGRVALEIAFMQLEATSYAYNTSGVQTNSSVLDYNIATGQVSQQTPLPGVTTPNAPGLWLTGGTSGTPAAKVHHYRWEVDNADNINGGGGGAATVGLLTLTVDLTDFQRLGDVARGRFFSTLNLSEYDTRGSNLVVLQKLLFNDALFVNFTVTDASTDGAPGQVVLKLYFSRVEATSYLYDGNGVQTSSSKLDYNIATAQVSQQTPLPGVTAPNAPGLWLTGGTTGTPTARVHDYHWQVDNSENVGGGGGGTATAGLLTLTMDLSDFQRLGDVARGRFFQTLNLSEYDTRGSQLVVLQKLLFQDAAFVNFSIADASSDGLPGLVTLKVYFAEIETTSYLYDANGVQTQSSRLNYDIVQNQVSQQPPLPGAVAPNTSGLWLTGGTSGTPATKVHDYNWQVMNSASSGGGGGVAAGLLTLKVDLTDFQRLGDLARGRFFPTLNLSEYGTRGSNLVVLQKLLFEDAVFADFVIADTSNDGIPGLVTLKLYFTEIEATSYLYDRQGVQTHSSKLDYNIVSNQVSQQAPLPYFVAPVNLTLSSSVINEHQTSMRVGRLLTTDFNDGSAFRYELVSGSGSGDNSAFMIQGDELWTVSGLDFEQKSTYSIRVRTTNDGDFSFEKVFTISVINLYEPVSIIDFGQPGYQEVSGTWGTSGVFAGVNGSSTRMSNTSNASVRWNTEPLEPGWYQVEIWNVGHSSNTTTAALSVKHGTQTTTSTFNHATSPSGWRSVGTYYFDGTSGNFVQLSKSGAGYLRADAVRFTSTAITVNNEDGAPSYQEPTGTWATSDAIQGSQGTSTRFSNSNNASVRWNAPTLTPGWYQVEFWNVAHASNVASGTVTVRHNSSTVTSTFNHATSPSGWRSVGTFYFDGSSDQYVQLSKSGSGYLRTDAVRFTPVVQSVVTIHNEEGAPRYQETGGSWANSGVVTGSDGSSTRYSNTNIASTRWSTASLTPGWYQVDLWNAAHSTNAASALATVAHNGTVSSSNFTHSGTPAGWFRVGLFFFNGVANEYVQLSKNGAGYLRADSVRFTAVIPPAILAHNENPNEFLTTAGSWQSSGLAGVEGGSIFSSSANAQARYNLSHQTGPYQIQVFIPAASNSTSKARYTIISNSISTEVIIDQRVGGWITLGDFNLGSSSVIWLTNLETGVLRADAIRLVPRVGYA